MRPLIEEIIVKLRARHAATARIDLNDIAEVIGDRSVSYDEVEAIIATLEDEGCKVGGPPTAREMGLLSDVLTAARNLREELGRAPSIAELAEQSGHPEFVVRRALENAGAMKSSTK